MRASAEVFRAVWALRVLMTLVAISYTVAFNFADDAVEVFDDPTRGRNGGRGSYFGFSVGLQRQGKDGSYRLLVGAPRANSTAGKYKPTVITEPGAVFNCDLNRPQVDCKEIVLDPTGNSPVQGSSETAYHDLKNFGWLGGAMDIQPNRIHATAACAYRWKNQRISSTYLINGACYWFNSSHTDDAAIKLLPLIPRSKQIFTISQSISVFNYAHGQTGTSVHFPDIDGELLMGAPGVFNWRGTVIRAKDYNAEGPGGNSRRRRSGDAVLRTRRRSGREMLGDLADEDKFSDFFVPIPYATEEIADFSLFGYSVTSGRFWSNSQPHYVAGAPRGADSLGQVFIFLFPLDESRQYNIFAEYRGEQLGEYFGAAVAAPDLTGDQRAELVVGAPLYALKNSPDVGRVYVYVNRGGSLYLSDIRYSGSEVTGARFGTTLMAPGDLNNDGFGDLLVGAPFENEGEGAVYVYYGSREGLRPTFSQRLSPAGMSSSSSTGVLGTSSLRGFGMSISRGADVDGNGYADVAIGSHDSGHAVLLRTKSVAKIKGHLSFSPTRLSLEDEDFTVSACLNYSGFRVPSSQDVLVRLTLDAGLPSQRAFFQSGGNSITYDDTLRINTVACKDHPANVAKTLSDYRQAIQLRLEYRLASDGPFEDRKGVPDTIMVHPTPHTRTKRQLPPGVPNPLPQVFSALPPIETPVMDPDDQSSTLDQLSFVTGCEDDGDTSCASDMVLNATFSFKGYPTFEIGSLQPVILHLAVKNLGEPAFLPNLTVVVPYPIDLVEPVSHSCIRHLEDYFVTLHCDLPGPLKKDNPENIDIVLDMLRLSDESPAFLKVHARVSSASEIEKNHGDNVQTLDLDLQASADLRMHGVSEEEQVMYSRLDADTINTTDLLTTTHTINIVKHGPTPLKEVILEVEIPVNISTREAGNHNFAQIFMKEAQLDRQPFQCHLKGASFTHDASEEENILSGSSTGIDYDLVGTDEDESNDHTGDKEVVMRRRRRRRSDDTAGAMALNKQSDGEVMEKEGGEKHKVMIWSGWKRVSQALMTCNILGWPRGTKVAKLSFSTQLNMTILSRLMFASKGADFMTTARARVSISNPELHFTGPQSVSGNVTTHLVPGMLPGASVPWWIILLAILAGLLVLFLLVFGLYKLGFFRRKKQEQMQEIKANIVNNEYGATDETESE